MRHNTQAHTPVDLLRYASARRMSGNPYCVVMAWGEELLRWIMHCFMAGG